MTHEEFMIEVENSHNRSKRTLIKKAAEYSPGGAGRLDQFYRAGVALGISPTSALFTMAMKHITSIADMVECPGDYKLKVWNEKVGDLRNYTYLLDALIRDLEID